MRINTDFFNQPNIKIAKELLGKILVHKTKEGIIKGIINETELYTENDEASHSYKGRITERNRVMFYEAGHLYIYLTYGMYFCCNIVIGKKGVGEAILIRSVIPLDENSKNLMIKNRGWYKKELKNLSNGPGKVCIAYSLNKKHNGINLLDKNSKIYLENLKIKPLKIFESERIGITKAINLKWRFYSKKFKNNKGIILPE